MTDDGKLEETARAGFEDRVAAAQGDGRQLAELAVKASRIGLGPRVYALAREAQALAPDDADVASSTSELIAGGVPGWHFYMVLDEARNTAFEAAIKRAVTPDTRVLDIGAGTGLLAMMAARAGAASVTSCEMNPAIADAATEIVALNGYADRVRILSAPSTAIGPEDLGGKATLIVSEIVSNNLLSEDVLPTMADAVERLLAPGGKMIPEAGQIVVSLADWDGYGRDGMEDVAGFDMRPFNRLEQRPLRLKVGDRGIELRGDPADLFDFDFTTGGPWPDEQCSVDLIADGNYINGVIQWIRLRVDAKSSYENRPKPETMSNWAALFVPFGREIVPPAGTIIRVYGAHDRHSVRIWVDEQMIGADR
jgi:protein arginine N-methyltransferase 7